MNESKFSADHTFRTGIDTDREAFKSIEKTVDDASNEAKRVIGQAADQASETVDKLGGGAKEAYGYAAQRAQKAADVLNPLMRERPYAALGLAAVAGIVLGLLAGGRAPRAN
jgi:ElaB/YqjD/DUF883 family membrane-anchored ribosome-binding protein